MDLALLVGAAIARRPLLPKPLALDSGRPADAGVAMNFGTAIAKEVADITMRARIRTHSRHRDV